MLLPIVCVCMTSPDSFFDNGKNCFQPFSGSLSMRDFCMNRIFVSIFFFSFHNHQPFKDLFCDGKIFVAKFLSRINGFRLEDTSESAR
jgi:hypothetical protein